MKSTWIGSLYALAAVFYVWSIWLSSWWSTAGFAALVVGFVLERRDAKAMDPPERKLLAMLGGVAVAIMFSITIIPDMWL